MVRISHGMSEGNVNGDIQTILKEKRLHSTNQIFARYCTGRKNEYDFAQVQTT